jgi:hypothetical protein
MSIPMNNAFSLANNEAFAVHMRLVTCHLISAWEEEAEAEAFSLANNEAFAVHI